MVDSNEIIKGIIGYLIDNPETGVVVLIFVLAAIIRNFWPDKKEKGSASDK
jgi:hypothetical protein